MKAITSGGLTFEAAAAKAGVSENTARKYRRSGVPPSQMASEHSWRTRRDPFQDCSDEIEQLLGLEPGLEAKTIFEHLRGKHPDCFSEGQLRSLQRRVKIWRATKGPGREIFFAQEHHPGDIGQSDFCHAGRLRVTISGQIFDHLLYHFVLTYSNWEFTQVCFSESLESLGEGLQSALWTAGGVPRRHRTDSLSAAVRNVGKKQDDRDEFTDRYRGLIAHYGMDVEHTQPSSPNENGDVEQSHNRFLRRIDQALMLRGSREFASRTEYQEFLRHHCDRANRNRVDRFAEEQANLKALPSRGYDIAKRLVVRVGPGSTIRVLHNAYSVPSSLIDEQVQAVVRSETIEVVYAQTVIARMPRLRGRKGYLVDYRHIIDWLVKKPGAFDQYVYRAALFPSSRFRMAYDALVEARPDRGARQYLLILQLAARHGESGVEEALRALLDAGKPVGEDSVLAFIERNAPAQSTREVSIAPINLLAYDALIETCGSRASEEAVYA
jgi:transposase